MDTYYGRTYRSTAAWKCDADHHAVTYVCRYCPGGEAAVFVPDAGSQIYGTTTKVYKCPTGLWTVDPGAEREDQCCKSPSIVLVASKVPVQEPALDRLTICP